MVIALGKSKASRLYAGLMAMTYLSVIGGVVSKLMPATSVIAFASMPFALKAVRRAFKYHDDIERLIPALKANVIAVLGTDALLAFSYFLKGVWLAK